MIKGRICCYAAAFMVLGGCSSTPEATPPAPAVQSSGSAAPTSSGSPAPTTKNTSAFCLDLSTFDVASLRYKAEVGRAAQGTKPDLAELRRVAAIVADLGAKMLPTAPADIAGPFRAVVDSVATSASKLKPGAKVKDVFDPLYNKTISPSWDAVQGYRSCG